jgi:hypothetical protein
VASAAQTRAVNNYRKRLSKLGMARFEILGLKKDRELLRAVARRMAENTQEAEEMRASVRQKIAEKPGGKGSLIDVLRSWPLAELDLMRPHEEGRKINL